MMHMGPQHASRHGVLFGLRCQKQKRRKSVGWLSLERGLLHKPNDVSSIPRTHIKEAENQLHTVVAAHAQWYMYIPTYIVDIIIIIIHGTLKTKSEAI